MAASRWPESIYFACCQWWLADIGWPRPCDDYGVLVCPRCGHWLVFHAEPRAVYPLPQAAIERVIADRPDLARLLVADTAEHVRQRPCCKGAWGDA